MCVFLCVYTSLHFSIKDIDPPWRFFREWTLKKCCHFQGQGDGCAFASGTPQKGMFFWGGIGVVTLELET